MGEETIPFLNNHKFSTDPEMATCGKIKSKSSEDDGTGFPQRIYSNSLTIDANMFEPYWRQKIANELKESNLSYIHEDAIRTEDGRWPGLLVIPLNDAIAIAQGEF
jgi:hypothetical protein